MKRVYRTAVQGRDIDLDQLMSKHEKMPAVGNVRVNARGDELGPNGEIIRTREEILAEYYDASPQNRDPEEINLSKVQIKSSRTNFTLEQNNQEQEINLQEIIQPKSKKDTK